MTCGKVELLLGTYFSTFTSEKRTYDELEFVVFVVVVFERNAQVENVLLYLKVIGANSLNNT